MTVAYNRLPPYMDIDDDGNVTQNTIEGTSTYVVFTLNTKNSRALFSLFIVGIIGDGIVNFLKSKQIR